MNIAVTISTVTHRVFHHIAKFPLLFYNQTLPLHPERKWRWKSLSHVWLFEIPWTYTVHGILQGRILEWVAFPFSGGSSQPRDGTQGSHIASGFFTSWATEEDQEYWSGQPIPFPADLPDPGIEPVSPELQVDSLPTSPLVPSKHWHIFPLCVCFFQNIIQMQSYRM